MTGLEKKLIAYITQADNEFSLFDTEQRVLVAVSGGKDSISLFNLLHHIVPDLTGIHIRLSSHSSLDFIKQNRLLGKIAIVESNILEETAGIRNRCFTCSRKRRQLILEFAASQGITKIAMGHHRDDVVETLLMNMIYSREISTLHPKQVLFKGLFTIIRPLYYVPEKLLTAYSKEKSLLTSKPLCKEDFTSKRKYIKDQIETWQKDHPDIDVKDNLFSSLRAVKTGFLPFQPL